MEKFEEPLPVFVTVSFEKKDIEKVGITKLMSRFSKHLSNLFHTDSGVDEDEEFLTFNYVAFMDRKCRIIKDINVYDGNES